MLVIIRLNSLNRLKLYYFGLLPIKKRFENFSTTDAAQRAATPTSVVLEAAGKIWLLTPAAKGDRSKGATFVAETELLPPIPRGPSYEIVVSQANLGPDANVMTHKHSGPETWFLLTGEQCLELPDRTVRARAGQTMSAPAETPMKLNVRCGTPTCALRSRFTRTCFPIHSGKP
jgi:quercetin dioxygenase-like cupin family protein